MRNSLTNSVLGTAQLFLLAAIFVPQPALLTPVARAQSSTASTATLSTAREPTAENFASTSVPSSATTGYENKWIKIVNQRSSGYPVWAVYITPAGDDDWGTDQLNGDTIGAGRSYRWTIPWDGCYVDIKAVTFTGLRAEQYGVNVCGGFVWTLYDK